MPICAGHRGGEEGEVCFRLMSLTPEHSHQACNEVNRSLTPHSLSAVCSVFRALSDSRGLLLYQSRRSLEYMDQVGLYIFKERSSKCEGKRGELNDTFLHKNKYKLRHYNVESTQALRC